MNQHQTELNLQDTAANTAAAAASDRIRAEYLAGLDQKLNDAETGEIEGVAISADEAVIARAAEHGTTETSEMIDETKRQVARWRNLRRGMLSGSAAIIPVSIAALSLLIIAEGRPLAKGLGLALLIASFGAPFSMFGFLFAAGARPRGNTLLSDLTLSGNVWTAGPLAEVARMTLPNGTSPEMTALIRLLPRLKAADGQNLTVYQRTCLRQLLEASRGFAHSIPRPDQERLSVTILSALSEIGTSDDLPVVRRFAAGYGIARRSLKVREAAQKCLPIIEERVAAGRSTDHLLRASGAPSEAENVLLRAATGGTNMSGEQLLRPGGAERPQDGSGTV